MMKILVTGLGSIGQRHVRNLIQLYGDTIELSAYRTRGRDLVLDDSMTATFGTQPEEAYNIKTYKSLGRSLAEKPDAILVTNPNNLHMPTALSAAKQGCHLFIDKPLSDSLEGVLELQKIVRSEGLIVLIGYQLRFHPALRRIKKIVESGRIGQVVSANFHFGEYLPGQHPYEDYREGYAAHSDQGGGVILCLIHEIDLAYWFFGMPIRVYAVGGHLSELDIDTEDTADILLQYDMGGRQVPVSVHLDFVQKPPKRGCDIVGSKGKISWDYISKELSIFERQGPISEIVDFSDFDRNQEFLAEMAHFIECIQSLSQSRVNLEDGINSLKIALAAKESLATGMPITLLSD